MHNVKFFKEIEFYQRLLAESYQRFLAQSGEVIRYYVKGRFYEIRDCDGDDISNIALRDGQMSCLFLGNQIPIKRLTASQEDPNVPIGFYLVKGSEHDPEALELFFNYASPNVRGSGIGLLQRIDALISVLLTKETKGFRFTKVYGNSSFYESLDGICSSRRVRSDTRYNIDLSDKERVKRIIGERLVDIGIRISL